MVYLLLDEKKDKAYIKIGSTFNFFQRIIVYVTHNANFEILGMIQTYQKTKFKLENECRKELLKNGYRQHVNRYTGIKTEWFTIDYNDKFYQSVKRHGFKAFKCCQSRKVITWEN